MAGWLAPALTSLPEVEDITIWSGTNMLIKSTLRSLMASLGCLSFS